MSTTVQKEPFRRSRFRSKFQLDQEDRGYIADRGMDNIKLHAHDFIRSRLGPAEPRNDGKQTPFKGHPVFKAQHAVAACCRGCLKKWYGIEKGRPLKQKEIERAVTAIMGWIEIQLKASA